MIYSNELTILFQKIKTIIQQMALKNITKKLITKLGFRILKLQNNPLYDSEEPFTGIKFLMSDKDRRGVFFDVGANIGQTVEKLKSYFPEGRIYAFEPGTAFPILQGKYDGTPKIHLENVALGSTNGLKTFYTNSESDMSSFLPLGKEGWGYIISEQKVAVKTLDTYCADNNIEVINLLKSDTQGFELEVLLGGKNTIKNIQFILLEINFKEIYKGLPTFSEIFNYLSSNEFQLVRFYEQKYSNNFLNHVDVLFCNPNFSCDN